MRSTPVMDWSGLSAGQGPLTLKLRGAALETNGELIANDTVLAGAPLPDSVDILLPTRADSDSVWKAQMDLTATRVSEISRELLGQISKDASLTAIQLKTSFKGFTTMVWITFYIGVSAFVLAIVRGATASSSTDLVVTGIFGGLSTASFVSTFITRPTGAMGQAGLRAAWLQVIVTSYWAKLAYMDNPTSVLQDLDAAQSSLAEQMERFLRATTSGDRAPARRRSRPSPEQPQPQPQPNESAHEPQSGPAPAPEPAAPSREEPVQVTPTTANGSADEQAGRAAAMSTGKDKTKE